MSLPVEEAKQKITLTWGALAYLVGLVIIITSTYWRFEVTSQEVVKTRLEIDNVNGRLDRKYDRLETTIKELENRIKELEKPQSDGK